MADILSTLSDFLFPQAIPLWQALLLIGFSFFTSLLAASIGIGGGVAMMGAMSSMIPVSHLIAVHGLVQLGSNSGRAFLLRSHISWPIVWGFAGGGIFGAALGGYLFVSLPEDILMAALGGFLLWVVWAPKIPLPYAEHWGMPLVGATASFFAMFFGAMGPLVNAALQRKGLDKQQLIGTQSACLILQHGLKIIVLIALGISLNDWIGMIILMILMGFAGTYTGTHILQKIPEKVFQKGLKLILTLIALGLIRRSLGF